MLACLLVDYLPLFENLLHFETSNGSLCLVDKLTISLRPLGEKTVEVLHLLSLAVIDGSQFLFRHMHLPMAQAAFSKTDRPQLTHVFSYQRHE